MPWEFVARLTTPRRNFEGRKERERGEHRVPSLSFRAVPRVGEERPWEMVKLARNFVHRENSAPGPCIMYSCIRWREGRRRLGQVQEGNIQKGRGATPLASSSFFFFLSIRETSDRGEGFYKRV